MKKHTSLFLYSIVLCLLFVSTAYSQNWNQSAKSHLQHMISQCNKLTIMHKEFLKDVIELQSKATYAYDQTNIEDFNIAHNTFIEAEKNYNRTNYDDACQLFEQALRNENVNTSDSALETIQDSHVFTGKAEKLKEKGIDQYNAGVNKL